MLAPDAIPEGRAYARLLAPAVYATAYGNVLKGLEGDLSDVAEEAPGLAPPAAPARTLRSWYDRGSGWRKTSGADEWTPLFQIEVVRLAYTLSSLGNLKDVFSNSK